MMKKNVVLMTALMLVLTLFGGCTAEHIHAGGEWDRDAKQHWKLCECGEKAEAGEHKLDEGSVCTACGSQVLNFEDSSAVFDMDEHGNFTRVTYYEKDGSVESDEIRRNTYDESGNLLSTKYYENGTLYMENTFAVDANGEPLTLKTVSYMDGGKMEAEYDENGYPTAERVYEGEILTGETLYTNEYALDEDLQPWLIKVIARHTLSGVVETTGYSSIGRMTLHRIVDADGNEIEYQRWEFDFDPEGYLEAEREYDAQGLVNEVEYGLTGDGGGDRWSYVRVYTEYFPDGSKTVTENNEFEEVVRITTYDANGNIQE